MARKAKAIAVAETPEVRTEEGHGRDTSKHGKRLTQTQIVQILNLASNGKNNSEIARIVACDDSTVGATLARFGDARSLARKMLEAGSARLAQTVVKTKDSAVALKALGKLDVVREDQAQAGNTLVAVFNAKDGDAHLFEPPVIDVSPRIETTSAPSPALSMAVTVDSVEAKGPPNGHFRQNHVA